MRNMFVFALIYYEEIAGNTFPILEKARLFYIVHWVPVDDFA